MDNYQRINDLISVGQVDDSFGLDQARKLLFGNSHARFKPGDQDESLWPNSRGAVLSAENVQRRAWIYSAKDRGGRCRAAAIAAYQNDGSVRINPIAAADPTAFRALVLDLPMLLAGRTHKAYIYCKPDREEILALQDGFWSLEGLDRCIAQVGYQKWGCDLDERMLIPSMRIQDRYLCQIASGEKTLEIRVAYSHIRAVQPGGTIRFISATDQLRCIVMATRNYADLDTMIQHEDAGRILPRLDADEALRQLREIYPPHKERLGIVVLEISKRLQDSTRID